MDIIEYVEQLAADAGFTFEDWQLQSVVRMYIQRLIGPDTYLPGAPVGPYEFPRSSIEVRGPVTQHRYHAWQKAVYPQFEFDERASLDALDVPKEIRNRIADECDFIRRHTPAAPVWELPDDPLLNAEWKMTAPGSWRLDGKVHDDAIAASRMPKPSTTPPMWAHDPTRSRRPRRHRNQPNRQASN